MKLTTRRITFAGVLAAVYAALTLATAAFAYGPVQFRIAEALSVLCCFTPYAVPGLAVGCMAANLASSVSSLDFLIGTAATLLAGSLTWILFQDPGKNRLRPWLVPLPTILCNALIVGVEIAFFFDDRAFSTAFALDALSVGLGETVVMYALGMPLLFWILRTQRVRRQLETI